MFKDLLLKYFKKNKKQLFCKDIVHEMDGSVLMKTSYEQFKFNNILMDEIKKYCKEQGYDIDEVLFATFYQVNIEDSYSKSNSDTDSKIFIVKYKEKYIAQVFIGSWVKFYV